MRFVPNIVSGTIEAEVCKAPWPSLPQRSPKSQQAFGGLAQARVDPRRFVDGIEEVGAVCGE